MDSDLRVEAIDLRVEAIDLRVEAIDLRGKSHRSEGPHPV